MISLERARKNFFRKLEKKINSKKFFKITTAVLNNKNVLCELFNLGRKYAAATTTADVV
jgi:hypothetical protein